MYIKSMYVKHDDVLNLIIFRFYIQLWEEQRRVLTRQTARGAGASFECL